MTWDGKDRRNHNDHDLLTRIDTNLINFMESFRKHEEDDCGRFDNIHKRLVTIERMCYGIGGVFIFVEFISRMIK